MKAIVARSILAISTAVLAIAQPGECDAQSVRHDTLRARVTLRFDGENDNLPLKAISSGALLSDSSFILADRETPRVVRVVDGRGWQVARAGSGPGEYRDPAFLGTLGDTILIIEPLTRRLSGYVLSKRSVVTSIVVDPPPSEFEVVYPVSRTPLGFFFVESNADGDERITGRSSNVRLSWSTTNRKSKRVIETLSRPNTGLSVPVEIDGRPFLSATIQPFVASPLWSASKTGHGIVVADAFIVASASEQMDVRVRQWDSSGALVRSCTWRERASPLTDAVFNRQVGGMFQDPRIKVRRDDLEREIVRPRHVPTISAAIFASDGSIWLRTALHFVGASDAYVRFGPSGCTDRTVIVFDAHVNLLDARASTVLASLEGAETPEARLYRATPYTRAAVR